MCSLATFLLPGSSGGARDAFAGTLQSDLSTCVTCSLQGLGSLGGALSGGGNPSLMGQGGGLLLNEQLQSADAWSLQLLQAQLAAGQYA